MKPKLFFASLLFFLSIIANAQTDEDNTFEYSDGVTFTIKHITNSKIFDMDRKTLVAPRGTRFKMLYVAFENNSAEDVEIDFSTFHLLDKSNAAYDALFAVQAMKFTGGNYTFKYTLKAGKSKKYSVVFSPYPKDETIYKMVVAQDIINLTGF